MSAAKIVLIGNSGVKQGPLIAALEKRYTVFIAHSGKQGLTLARKHNPQVVILDAISLRTPGDRICQNLQDNLSGIPIIHLYPGPGKKPKCQPDIVLVEPFTWRKVVNGIDRLLVEGENDHIITCGPFSMNVDRRVLIAHGHETPLTPKQALLIETFLRHPGETLPRKLLMERVWHTDYMGDTRTLDVHIRWVRKSLERDPRKPRYLKTVRGVGYRLEIP